MEIQKSILLFICIAQIYAAVKFSPILCQIDFIVSQKQSVVLLNIFDIVFDNYFDGRLLC